MPLLQLKNLCMLCGQMNKIQCAVYICLEIQEVWNIDTLILGMNKYLKISSYL